MKSNIIKFTMNISCPNCQTKFIVSSNQIGINGRRVRCSKCRHIWSQKLDYNTSKLSDFDCKANFEAVKTHIKNDYSKKFYANVPVILPYTHTPLKRKYNIFPILWTSFIIFCLAILLLDSFEFRKRYEQLKIEEVKLGNSHQAGVIKMFYKLSNNSDYSISDPLIKVRAIDCNNKALDKYASITKLKVKILPKQQVYMEMDVKGLPVNVKYIDVSIGNKIAFLFE